MIAWKGTNVILIGARERTRGVRHWERRGRKLEQSSTRGRPRGKWIKISIPRPIDEGWWRPLHRSTSVLYRGQWTRRLAASQRNITLCISPPMKIAKQPCRFLSFSSRIEEERSVSGIRGSTILWDRRVFTDSRQRRMFIAFVSDFIVVEFCERIEGDIEKLRDEQRGA